MKKNSLWLAAAALAGTFASACTVVQVDSGQDGGNGGNVCTANCDGRLCGDDGCGGSCGDSCAAPLVCDNASGQCVSSCAPSQKQCGKACVVLATDRSNCGSCGKVCGVGESCVSSVCKSPPTACAPGATVACSCPGVAVGSKKCDSAGSGYGACACTWKTNIEHVVLIVQEHHTFDSYFGAYCTGTSGPLGTPPACTTGPACCEAAPSTVGGQGRYALTDAENYSRDHDHSYSCEVCQINGGAMDHFLDRACPGSSDGTFTYGCSSPYNFELAVDSGQMATYWGAANSYALADRYFQPMAGSTSGNDMYFAVAHYEFADNSLAPQAIGVTNFAGTRCANPTDTPVVTTLPGRTTIADVLMSHGFTFKTYADGYADAVLAAPSCPPAGGTHCHESFVTNDACKYDPSDIPFNYYPQLADKHIVDVSALAANLASGTLPSVSFVKFRTSENEHPGWSWVSDGENNVAGIINNIYATPAYAKNTLVLLTWDEGGGFYDHVPPPVSAETAPTTAGPFEVPYGTRVPMLAIGPFAKTNYISHRQMEHSSIVKFLEWNFVGPSGVGAIAATFPSARDGSPMVNGIGDMLNPSAVGVTPP
jgi:phospholipase C